MRRASLHTIFWVLLTIAITFLLSYVFIKINAKNAALLTRDLRSKADKYTIPIFEIRDVKYSESGSVAELTFDLVNMGDDIVTRGWRLEFLTPQQQVICRTTLFTGDPTESGRIYTEIYVPSRNVTISDVDQPIFSGETAEVTITLLSTCLNKTIDYARTGEKMIIRLGIGSTSSSVITRCNVDPTTGFASCTE
jgi:hypothetical protein